MCRETIPRCWVQLSSFGVMGMKRVEYRCVATSVEGFVQQVAVQYLRHGYWFYVAGQVPEGKDPAAVDAKLIKKYGIDVSRWERARRKRAGLANMQYIRHKQFFLLMATHGKHRFFEDEAGQVRDARRVPIKFAGYAMSFRGGHASVRIEQNAYRRLKSTLVEMAAQRAGPRVAADFHQLHFVPYAPVRKQLLSAWRAVNRARKAAGLERISIECVPWRRQPVRPFRDQTASEDRRPAKFDNL